MVRCYRQCADISDFMKDVDFVERTKDSSVYEVRACLVRLVIVCATNRLYLYVDSRPGCDVIIMYIGR